MNTPANDRYLRLPEVMSQTGLSKQTIYAKMAEGTFPDRVPLSTRCVGWRESDIAQWKAAPMQWRAAA